MKIIALIGIGCLVVVTILGLMGLLRFGLALMAQLVIASTTIFLVAEIEGT